MLLSDVAVKRPVVATVANLLLIALGLLALGRLPVRQYPDIDPPVVSITTTYPGASASVMESDVTKRIEDAVSGVEGIRSLTSSSSDENSRIDIEFLVSRNIEYASADVRDQLGRIRKQLPEGIDDPIVQKTSSSDRPMVWISLSSTTRSTLDLTDFARRNLVDSLSVVPGVARVFIGGERRYAMRVWLDPQRLVAHQVTANDVVARLNDENVELPAGRLESIEREMNVRTTTRFATAEQFAAMIIRDQGGAQVRLGDVARVELGAADYRTGIWVDGKPAIGLGVIKQSTANALDVASHVKEAFARLRAAMPPDITAVIPYDESVFISASIHEVISTLGYAVALVVGVILIFLRSWTVTLIPALAIPVSLTATLMVMTVCGFSINVLTLLAFVLAIGLVVDDAIVVVENVFRRCEAGEPRLLAAVTGTREVGFAVIATTLVLVAVFVPVSFQSGTVGRLFAEFGITLAATVAFSGFVALTWAPMLASKLLRRSDQEGAVAHALGRGFDALENAYAWVLGGALRMRWLVLLVAIGVLAWGVVLMRGTKNELAPSEDGGFAFITLDTPQGSTMDATLAHVAAVERVIRPLMGDGPDHPVDKILSIVPAFNAPGGSVSSAFVIARLKDWDQRTMTQQQVVEQLKGKIFPLPGMRGFAINRPSFGIRDFGQSLQFVLGGSEYDQVTAWSQALLAKARAENPKLLNLFDDVDMTKPQLQITIDRPRAADLGLTVADIGNTLSALFGELKATRFEERGEEYDVVLQAQAERRRGPEALDGIYVRSGGTGKLVPLTNVVTVRQAGVPKELKRVDRLAAVTINASLAPDYSIGEAATYFEELARRELPLNAHIAYTGQAKEFKDNASGQWFVLGMAFVIVILVLAAQFESWIHPFIIIISAPLAAVGALAVMSLNGVSLNVYSKIGLVMLIGLVAKNGILMVEFANQLRDRGLDIVAAIHQSARVRLRPILMTSVATIAGAVPLALAHGAGSEGRQAIGWVVVGGLSVGTLLTLLVVPVIYAYLARFTRPIGAIAGELEQLEREQAAKLAAAQPR